MKNLIIGVILVITVIVIGIGLGNMVNDAVSKSLARPMIQGVK